MSEMNAILIDVLNGLGALFMILVGALLLSDGLGDGQLPFLLIGLLLIAFGVLRIAHRLIKGKWFRLWG